MFGTRYVSFFRAPGHEQVKGPQFLIQKDLCPTSQLISDRGI